MKIKLYDECGRKNIFDNLKYLSNGECGSVYLLEDNKCLKYITDEYAYDVNAFNTINNLELPNFTYVYKLLFNTNGNFGGYIMKYYKKEIEDILTTETAYTLENLKQIIFSIKKITDEGILVKDLNSNNVILGKDIMTIIDFDMYKYSRIAYEQLNKYNYQYVMFLFKCLYLDCLHNYHKTTLDSNKKINELFNDNNTFQDISKKLIKYKYPIDYVK